MKAVIGALKVLLGIDISEFATGSTKAQSILGTLQKEITGFGTRWMNAGKSLSVGVTAPITGAGVAILKTAGDFEAGMGRVGISTKATSAQMADMRKLALQIGRDTGKSASEAADAMDMLAKNGMSAEAILRGGARAAVVLSEATGSQLDPAAAAVTDTMAQFNLTAKDTPGIVNGITGAVNESKLDFDDFQLAMGQAGGVAGKLGVELSDFNAVLAATSPMFASGSDAGTSFKNFLGSMVPKSKEAAAAMEQYGLKFFDANGKMKSMTDIAQMLRDKLGGLSEEAKTDVMGKLFGSDGMRTAIGLMEQGGAGIDAMRARIANTSAEDQAAERMKGFNGQLEQLGGALESLAIAIADTGLLTFITSLVTKFAAFVAWLSEAHPGIMKFVVIVAGMAAAMGPLMLVMGTLVGTLLPFFLARLSPIGMVISAIINPLGTLIAFLARFVAQVGLMTILRTVAPMLLRFLGPIGLIITAFQLFKGQVLPVLKELYDKLLKTLGPSVQGMIAAFKELVASIGAIFAQLMSGPGGQAIRWLVDIIGQVLAAILKLAGEVIIRAFNGLVVLITGVFKNITNIFKIFGALLSGDFSGAWRLMKEAARVALDNLLAVIKAVAPEAVKFLSGIYTGAKVWLQDKLGALIKWVGDKVRGLIAPFRDLWDAVVGHSYIPDLFDGIALHAARLDPEFVQPVLAGIAQVDNAFANMTGPNLPGITPAATDTPTAEDSEPAPVENKNAWVEGFKSTFTEGIKAALKGDLKGFFSKWFEDISTRALENAATALGNVLSDILANAFGGAGGGAGGGFFGQLAGMIFGGGGGLPGFATGGSFRVGGRSGIDRNLIAFRASKNEMVDVRKPGDFQRGSGNKVEIHFNGPVSNGREVRASAAQAAAKLARVSAAGARGI